VDNGIDFMLGSCNVQVFGLIDDEAISPYGHWNPDHPGNISDVDGGLDSLGDVETKSLETIILET
jgi:hypothetical protein